VLEKSKVENRVREESILLASLAMIDEIWGMYIGEWLGILLMPSWFGGPL
jgi:hypothetical protein